MPFQALHEELIPLDSPALSTQSTMKNTARSPISSTYRAIRQKAPALPSFPWARQRMMLCQASNSAHRQFGARDEHDQRRKTRDPTDR